MELSVQKRDYRREAELRSILDSIPQMVWTNDGEGRQTYYNKQWYAFTGLPVGSPEEVRRSELIHSDDRDAAMATWQHCLASGEYYEAEYRLRHHSGEYRWIASKGLPQRDIHGRITVWYGTCTDIHSRKLSLEALRVSEALNRGMIDATGDAILMLDGDAKIQFMNARAKAELPDETVEQMIGRSYFDAFPMFQDKLRKAFAEALETGVGRVSVLYQHPSSIEKYWDIALTRVQQSGKLVGILVTARDLTGLRLTEDRLHDLERELLHVTRLTAMGTMAGTLAHELNQPLAAATNYLAAAREIAERSGVPANVGHGMGEAERQLMRISEIIRRVRSMVTGQSTAERVSLTRLVTDAVRLVRRTTDAGDLQIVTEIAKDADRVQADVVQTEQVLVNLIRNAVEAMRHSPRRELRIKAWRDGECTVVEVRDTGPGIPPERIGNLFDSIGRSSKGLGLGLAISRTIVENQGGRIWAEPAGGGGTSFQFTIPVAAGGSEK